MTESKASTPGPTSGSGSRLADRGAEGSNPGAALAKVIASVRPAD